MRLVVVGAVLAAALLGQQAAPRAEECAGCHDSGPRTGKREPGVPPGFNVAALRASTHAALDCTAGHSDRGLAVQTGLTVTSVCTSCHTAHSVLPHTDPAASIAKANIAKTCTQCHAQIEAVHTRVIRGELCETQPHLIPACVDCHESHKARKV